VENLVSLVGGRAIVVAPNFRLGVFGFLALRELSAEDPRGVSE
jgi:carboxylesterase type B